MIGYSMIEFIFWVSLLLIIWTYFGYMIFLKAISIARGNNVKKREFYPPVSLIITAFNEEGRIKDKLENCLSLTYPGDKLEIIVVSDGSTDETEDIVRTYEDRGVKLLALPQRHGKHHGQGKGIEFAKNELLVLSDASTFLKEDAVEKIVENLADPEVGCVSGFDRIDTDLSVPQGEGFYVKYEMKLRELESAFGSLVGVSGSFFAVRRILCKNWIGDLSSDFYLPIFARMKNYRTVLENSAVGYYRILEEQRDEFARKVRTVVHGMEVLFKFKGILNPLRYGFFSIQMISHKLSRWLVPFYLLLLFLMSLMLYERPGIYSIALLLQIIFYMLALAGYLAPGLKKYIIFRIPLFFVMVNFSIIAAWHNFIMGNKFVIWEPTKR